MAGGVIGSIIGGVLTGGAGPALGAVSARRSRASPRSRRSSSTGRSRTAEEGRGSGRDRAGTHGSRDSADGRPPGAERAAERHQPRRGAGQRPFLLAMAASRGVGVCRRAGLPVHLRADRHLGRRAGRHGARPSRFPGTSDARHERSLAHPGRPARDRRRDADLRAHDRRAGGCAQSAAGTALSPDARAMGCRPRSPNPAAGLPAVPRSRRHDAGSPEQTGRGGLDQIASRRRGLGDEARCGPIRRARHREDLRNVYATKTELKDVVDDVAKLKDHVGWLVKSLLGAIVLAIVGLVLSKGGVPH